MRMHYDELAVPGVRALQPYQPGMPIAELERRYGIRNAIKLASNENPLGAGHLALAAAQQALADCARYPEGSGYLLCARLATRHGVASDAINSTPSSSPRSGVNLIQRITPSCQSSSTSGLMATSSPTCALETSSLSRNRQ